MDLTWFAPFYSGGGYCSEAQSFVSSLHAHRLNNSTEFNFSFRFSHHGDSWNADFLKKLSRRDKDMYNLYDSTYGIDSKKHDFVGKYRISVCHSEPGAWHAPLPKYYTVQCPPSISGTTNSYRTFDVLILNGRCTYVTNRLQNWSHHV